MTPTTNKSAHQALPWDSPRICVIGDVMVDAYMWGRVTRMSPEAPVPVVEVDRKEQRVGGAGNVVKNLSALGAKVDLISVVGNDDAGHALSSMLAPFGTAHLIVDASRPTTVKTRIISGGHHVVRVDEEATSPVVEAIRNLAAEKLELLIDSDMPPEVVLIEDYNKGLLTLETIERVLTACDRANIPVAVDPKLEQFTAYRGVALFSPTSRNSTKDSNWQHPFIPDHRDSMECAIETLMDTLQCEQLMVTLGSMELGFTRPKNN